MAYVVPSVKIYQQFAQVAVPVSPDLPACIIGPNKQYLDITDASDKQTAYLGLYEKLGLDPLLYPGREAGSIVEQDSVQLWMDNTKAIYFSDDDGEVDPLFPNILKSVTPNYFCDYVNVDGTSYPLSTGLHNRCVKVGDYVKLTKGIDEFETKIVGLQNIKIAAVTGSPASAAENHENIGNVDTYVVLPDAVREVAVIGTGIIGFNGEYKYSNEDTTYTVGCTIGGAVGTAEFVVTDSGTDLPAAGQRVQTVVGTRLYPIGSRGIILTVSDENIYGAPSLFVVGDEWEADYVAVTIGNGVVDAHFAGSEYTGDSEVVYTVTCVKSGGSGVAQVVAQSSDNRDISGPHTVYDGQSFNIGSEGIKIKFILPGTGKRLVAGDSWGISVSSNNFGVEPVSVFSTGDLEADILGSYLHSENSTLEPAGWLLLKLSVLTPGAFGTAIINWALLDGDASTLYPVSVESGTIVTQAADDETTEYTLVGTLKVKFHPDGGVFVTDSEVTYSYSPIGILEITEVNSHDRSADTVALVSLAAEAVDENYEYPSAVTPDIGNSGAGTFDSSGRYLNEAEDLTYTVEIISATSSQLQITVTPSVGTESITTVTWASSDIATAKEIGTRGVMLTPVLPTGNIDVDFDATDTYTLTAIASSSLTVIEEYAFTSPIVYTVEVITGGVLGTAELTVTTTGGLDNDLIVTELGITDYYIGSRGLKVRLGVNPVSEMDLGDKWIINTALKNVYTGTVDGTYYVTVETAGALGEAEIYVTSTMGDTSGPTKILADTSAVHSHRKESLPVSIGNHGVLVRFTDPGYGLMEGDIWTVGVTSERLGGYSNILLSRSVPEVLQVADIEYDVMLVENGIEVPAEGIGGTYWEVDASTITINGGATFTTSTVYDLVGGSPVLTVLTIEDGARIYVTYEALLTGSTMTLFTINSVDEIEGILGRIDTRNPLAFGVYKALQNTDTPVKALRISSDDSIGYQEAIDYLATRIDVYGLVPLTKNPVVIQAFKDHVDFMSEPDRNKFRIAIVNQALPLQEYIKNYTINEYTGEVEDYTATIIDDPNAADLSPPMYTKVIGDDNSLFLTDGVTAGDFFLTNFHEVDEEEVFDEYEIDLVINDETLLLLTGPLAPVMTAQKYQIVRKLEKFDQATAYANIAKSYLDHRVYLVWPDYVGVEGEEVDGYYLCCGIVGMVAGFPPHQGFTNIGVVGFDDVSRSTQYFKESELNVMAEVGVYIITQDTPGAMPYCRHQVSTDNTSVTLRELSITKNLDYISFYFRNRLSPFIGVWNATSDAVDSIELEIKAGTEYLKTLKLPKIGAPLLDLVINSIVVNELLRDNIDIDTDALLPYPLNYINHTIRVS